MSGRNLKLTLALVLIGAVAVVAMACGSSANETAPADDLTATIRVDATRYENNDDTHENTVSLSDDHHAVVPTNDANGANVAHHEGAHGDHDGHETDILDITLGVIEGTEWAFDPPLIEVPVGQRVRLTLVNDGRAEHDVEIAALVAEHMEAAGEEHGRLGGGHHAEGVVATHAMPGTESSVLFTATKAGSFEFACTIPGHKESGMVGTIVVTN